MRLSPGWFNHRNSGVWWNCLRSAASIIDTSGERRSHLVLFGRLTPYASRRLGRRTNRSVVPPRRSHQRTSSSRSSPKGHQAGKISPPRSSGEPQALIIDLHRDARMRYVLIFKNHGEEAGAHTTSHSISRLVALPITPRAIKNKLIIAREYFAEKERCIYCDVVRQELQDRSRLIAESKDFVVFAPFASRFPFEMAVFPRSHSSAFTLISPKEV